MEHSFNLTFTSLSFKASKYLSLQVWILFFGFLKFKVLKLIYPNEKPMNKLIFSISNDWILLYYVSEKERKRIQRKEWKKYDPNNKRNKS